MRFAAARDRHPQVLRFARAMRALAEVLRFVRTLRKVRDDRVDRAALQLAVDLVLFVRANLVRAAVPHALVPRAFPEPALDCVAAAFVRGWSFDPFALLRA